MLTAPPNYSQGGQGEMFLGGHPGLSPTTGPEFSQNSASFPRPLWTQPWNFKEQAMQGLCPPPGAR